LMNGAANPAAAGAASSAATPSTGLISSANAGLKEYAPLINATTTGVQTAQGAMGPEEAALAPPQIQPPMNGTQSLGDVAASRQQAAQQTFAQADQERAARRLKRRGLLG